MARSEIELHYKKRVPTSPHKTRFEYITRKPPEERMIVGKGLASPNLDKIRAAGFGGIPRSERSMTAGVGASGLGSIIDLINSSKDNPVSSMDVIEQVRWGMLGPQTPASINANFGAEIDLFGSGKSVAGIDFVETTMAQTGQTQTFF